MTALRTVFGNVLAIYRRELQSYLASPLAYVIAAIFWLLGGFFLVVILFSPEGMLAQVARRDQVLQMGMTLPPLDVAYEFLQGYFGVIGSLSMFVLPILSMGLYTEERKQGTLELLATSPVMNWVVALGKLLAVVTFYIGMVLPLMLCVAIALGTAEPAVSPNLLLVGNLGLILLAASVLSLGMFLSSLTSSTVVAAILTFALVIFLVDCGCPGPRGSWLAGRCAQSPLDVAAFHRLYPGHFGHQQRGVVSVLWPVGALSDGAIH
jgi:ABC-2 type transport system permease protein